MYYCRMLNRNIEDMRQIVVTAFLLLGFLSAQAQEEFTIRGKIEGMRDSTRVMLFRRDGDVGRNIARETAKDGTFCFRGKSEGDSPEMLAILCRGEGFPSMLLDVWVAPGADIRISGENNYLYTWKVESPLEQQRVRALFVEGARELWNEYQRLAVEDLRLRSDIQMADADERKALLAKWDSLNALRNELDIRIVACDLERMRQLPVSEVWMDRLRTLSMKTVYVKDFPYTDALIALYEGLPEEQKQTEAGRTIRTNLFPPTVVEEGDEMADADLYDLQGNVHRLADYKGRYMLVDIWSSGCGPCMMALPEMEEIAAQYGERLTVISLSCDREKSWRRASQEHNITWENLNDLQGTNGLYARYGVKSIPSYLLVSPEGKLLKKWSGYGEGSLKAALREWLGK